jgi:hypothetical protein
MSQTRPINYNVRDKNIVYCDNGDMLFFNEEYNKSDVKKLKIILNKSDSIFKSFMSKDNVDEYVIELGKTSKHKFAIYITIDNTLGIYSHIVIWNNYNLLVGFLYRELDINYEINKNPYSNIIESDRDKFNNKLSNYLNQINNKKTN